MTGEREQKKLNQYFESLIENAMPRGFIGEGSNEEIWLRHILDSLLVLQKKDLVDLFRQTEVVIDLGAGAGLPGIPLSIVFPDIKFVLVETMQKRANYLLETKRESGLDNVTVLNKRVEDLKVDDLAGEKRLVLFRAFLKPLVSLEMALRIMTEKSKVLYWRSRRFDISSGLSANAAGFQPSEKKDTGETVNADADHSGQAGKKNRTNPELQQINLRLRDLGYKVINFYNLECPVDMNSRGAYLLDYQGKLDMRYPRSWARIKKDPLINNVE